MAVAEVALTGEQLAIAYTQLNVKERRRFLAVALSQPAHRQAAVELLSEAQTVLKRKFSPTQQKQLDRLLDKNGEAELTATERKQLAQLMDEYGAGMIEKARAQYALELAQQAPTTTRTQ